MIALPKVQILTKLGSHDQPRLLRNHFFKEAEAVLWRSSHTTAVASSEFTNVNFEEATGVVCEERHNTADSLISTIAERRLYWLIYAPVGHRNHHFGGVRLK